MTDEGKVDDAGLEGLFEAARRDTPAVPDALMARVLADAEAVQPKAVRGGWASWLEALGGLPGVGGLVTATCVGVWLGIAPPDVLPDLAGQVLGLEAFVDDDLDAAGLTGFGWDIGEG